MGIIEPFTLVTAKLSAVFFIANLAPSHTYTRSIYIGSGLLVLWALAFTFANAFECKLPAPWVVTAAGCVNIVSSQVAGA